MQSGNTTVPAQEPEGTQENNIISILPSGENQSGSTPAFPIEEGETCKWGKCSELALSHRHWPEFSSWIPVCGLHLWST